MPPLPPVLNVLRIDLITSVGEDTDITTRLHFRFTGAEPSVSDCLAIAGDVATAWSSDMKPLMFTGNELTAIRVTDLSSDTASDATLPESIAGTRSGSFLPAGACLLANYLISRRYRGGKPRSYWPFGVQGDMQDGQKWTSGFLTSCGTDIPAFLAVVGAITQGSTDLDGPCNVSYYSGFTSVQNPVTKRWRQVNTLRGTPLVDTINSAVPATKIAYQRRRSVR